MQVGGSGKIVILQIYILTIAYLLLGSGLLLVDEYGGTYILLLRLRNTVFSSRWTPLALAGVGLSLAFGKVFLPVSPGPVLLGDFSPVMCLAIISLYHLTQAFRLARLQKHHALRDDENVHPQPEQEDMLRKTGSLIELHKRNLGFFILGASVLHFLFPGAVLL